MKREYEVISLPLCGRWYRPVVKEQILGPGNSEKIWGPIVCKLIGPLSTCLYH